MRMPAFFALAIIVGMATDLRADGRLTKLPADGIWALYATKETAVFPGKKVGDTMLTPDAGGAPDATSVAEFTLSRVGTKARSVLPEQK